VLTPVAFRSDWENIVTRFLYSPDVDRLLTEAANAQELDKVKENSTWYAGK
jgi:hypothetical protein